MGAAEQPRHSGGCAIATKGRSIARGLDIIRLRVLMVQGQSKVAAEYLQATSRVGPDKDNPGLVITA